MGKSDGSLKEIILEETLKEQMDKNSQGTNGKDVKLSFQRFLDSSHEPVKFIEKNRKTQERLGKP